MIKELGQGLNAEGWLNLMKRNCFPGKILKIQPKVCTVKPVCTKIDNYLIWTKVSWLFLIGSARLRRSETLGLVNLFREDKLSNLPTNSRQIHRLPILCFPHHMKTFI